MPVTFAAFPRDACGDATLLLAKFLKERGCGIFDYVLGERDGRAHAWLQQGNVVVDITPDRFADAPAPVIVSRGSAWHASLAIENGHVADLDAYDVPTRDRLRGAFGRIVQRVPDVREL